MLRIPAASGGICQLNPHNLFGTPECYADVLMLVRFIPPFG